MTWVRSTIYPGLQRPTNIERAGKGGGGLVLGKRIVLASCGRLTRGLRPEEVNEDENGIRTTATLLVAVLRWCAFAMLLPALLFAGPLTAPAAEGATRISTATTLLS